MRIDEEACSDNTDDEEDIAVTETTGKKRKRSGENHSHCHCPLYDVTDQLIDFMGGGQPYRRFKSAQVEKREAAKVDRIITVQRQKSDKPKYEMDMKKEVLRFKQTFKLAEKDQLPRSRLQVDLVNFHPP